MHTPSPEELEHARLQGADDAVATVRRLAPEDPLLRIAWAAGFGATDQVRTAVDAAREAGATWQQIAVVIGERDRTGFDGRSGLCFDVAGGGFADGSS